MLDAAAHAKHMTVRVAQVRLADVPWHVVRCERDFEAGGDALIVHCVNVLHPNRHPDALVAGFVSVFLERGGVRATAAASLRSTAKKNFALA